MTNFWGGRKNVPETSKCHSAYSLMRKPVYFWGYERRRKTRKDVWVTFCKIVYYADFQSYISFEWRFYPFFKDITHTGEKFIKWRFKKIHSSSRLMLSPSPPQEDSLFTSKMAAPSSFAQYLLGYGIFTFWRGEKISIGNYFCFLGQNLPRPWLVSFSTQDLWGIVSPRCYVGGVGVRGEKGGWPRKSEEALGL